jgi:type II secretory pathway pseudopilin PulG
MTDVRKRKQSGFTIIELVLAMGFLTALLLGIALTVIQLATTYNRGITITEVNQAGRTLNSELNSAIGQSGKFDVKEHFKTNDGGGRICTGQYSFIWNYAKALASKDQKDVTKYAPPNAATPINLIKVRDNSQAYCEPSASDPSQFAKKEVATIDVDDSAELLKPGERDLKVYQFNVALAAGGQDALSGQELYQASFTIGAGDVSAVTGDGTECRPPTDLQSNLEYCAVQQFSLVIRAGNGVN